MRDGVTVVGYLYRVRLLLHMRKGRDNLGRLKGRGYDLSHWTDVEGHKLDLGREWKIVYEGIYSRREHGRLDVPSMLTMSLAPVGILMEVVFLVLEVNVVSARRSQCPTHLQKASLTLAARSGYINKIVPIVGKGRGPHRATMHVNVDLDLDLILRT